MSKQLNLFINGEQLTKRYCSTKNNDVQDFYCSFARRKGYGCSAGYKIDFKNRTIIPRGEHSQASFVSSFTSLYLLFVQIRY